MSKRPIMLTKVNINKTSKLLFLCILSITRVNIWVFRNLHSNSHNEPSKTHAQARFEARVKTVWNAAQRSWRSFFSNTSWGWRGFSSVLKRHCEHLTSCTKPTWVAQPTDNTQKLSFNYSFDLNGEREIYNSLLNLCLDELFFLPYSFLFRSWTFSHCPLRLNMSKIGLLVFIARW